VLEPTISSKACHSLFRVTLPACRRAISSRFDSRWCIARAWSRMMPAVSTAPRAAAAGLRQGIGESDQARQRGAQVVRQRRQDRCAQPLRRNLQFAALRGVGVVQPLQGDRQQRRHRFQQGPLRAQFYRRHRVRGASASTPRTCVGATRGRKTMATPMPARDRFRQGSGARRPNVRSLLQFAQVATAVLLKREGLRRELSATSTLTSMIEATEKSLCDVGHLVDGQGAAEVARQIVERASPVPAPAPLRSAPTATRPDGK
jgi:hypothetical protein